jgi:hypothetical protein
MEPTYTVLGGDGNQYGPVTAEQLRGWARDGRIVGDTQVWRSDSPAWTAASALPELRLAAPVAAAIPGPIHVSAPAHDAELEKRVRSGASWFYWIAAISLINSVLILTGQQLSFALGLGITWEIDQTLSAANVGAKAIAFVIDAAAAGTLVLFGFFAGKGHAWSFIVGGLLLVLDAVLTILQQSWLSTAFHIWAIVSIFLGFKASRALRA